MSDYRKAWSSAVGYYSTHRNSRKDIYESEKYFLSKILKPGMSILDVGCAAGGFYSILKEMMPDISYMGIDVSEEMIFEAKRKHPGVRFERMRADKLSIHENFDIIFCSGVLHLDMNWREIIKECWCKTKKYFLFDVRLVQEAGIEDMNISFQKLALEGSWDGRSIFPYIILNAEDFLNFLLKLEPVPERLMAYGYFHPVANTVSTLYKDVCMTMFCLGKKKENRKEPIQWEVPILIKEIYSLKFNKKDEEIL